MKRTVNTGDITTSTESPHDSNTPADLPAEQTQSVPVLSHRTPINSSMEIVGESTQSPITTGEYSEPEISSRSTNASTATPSHKTNDSLEDLKQKALSGDAEAQFKLGFCYDKGQGVDKNDVEAFQWFQKAAEQGHAKAQFVLACIGLPLGEKKDDDTSASQVLSALSTLAGNRPVDLELSPQGLDMFQKRISVDSVPDTEITLKPANWTHWIAGIDACDIDLMSDMMYGRQILFDQRRWRAAMVFAVTLITLNISALNWDWWRLHREAQRLQQEIQSIYSLALHDVSNASSVDPVKALAEMKKKRMTLRRSAGEASADDFLAMSAALGDAWPVLQQIANINARAIASIEYRDASMELHLKPGLQFAIDTVRKVLSERGLELSSGSDMTVLKIRGMR